MDWKKKRREIVERDEGECLVCEEYEDRPSDHPSNIHGVSNMRVVTVTKRHET